MESEHCLRLGWQEESYNACRGNGGLRLSMVVTYYPLQSERGARVVVVVRATERGERVVLRC